MGAEEAVMVYAPNLEPGMTIDLEDTLREFVGDDPASLGASISEYATVEMIERGYIPAQMIDEDDDLPVVIYTDQGSVCVPANWAVPRIRPRVAGQADARCPVRLMPGTRCDGVAGHALGHFKEEV